jgi:endonuclease/exonuclease/phosphatase family metal-dependent hydrolase
MSIDFTHLTFITSNIRFDNPSDGDHIWDNRKDLLAKILTSHKPDIIGTQEGRKPQLKDFNSRLEGLELIESHRQWIEERMYPCLFYNPKRLKLIQSEDIWLSETPNIPQSKLEKSAFPRLAVVAEFQDLNTGEEIFVSNSHLDHIHEEVRVRQSQILSREIQQRKSNESHLVVLGDFNTDHQSDARAELISSLGLVDPWSSQEETTYHQFKGHHPTGKRIDWILNSKGFESIEIFIEKAQENGLYPSDHFPVISKLKL